MALYPCCPCCEGRNHRVKHVDPCSRHQRAIPKPSKPKVAS